MKILFAGGGTLGSVSPLIAVAEQIKKDQPQTEFLFIGSRSGPERLMAESYKIPFRPITAGKLRRYFDWHNFIDPFKILFGFGQSLAALLRFRPDAVAIAGSFVGVPVAWAAFILRVPILVHQQDIIPGLANKLMANLARRITVSFEPSLKDFVAAKTILTGNPVRAEIYDCDPQKSREIFKLKSDLPVLLVLGGGTGSQDLNRLMEESLADLLKFVQIIHITGHGKTFHTAAANYHQFEFLANEMTEAVCAADLVVTRAGMSTLSELIILAKPAIIVPLPDSHQEANAQFFQKNNAAKVLSQRSLNRQNFTVAVKELLFAKHKSANLSRNIAKLMPADGAKRVTAELLGLVGVKR